MRYIKVKSSQNESEKLYNFVKKETPEISYEYLRMVCHLAEYTYHDGVSDEGKFNIALAMLMVFLMDDTGKTVNYYEHLRVDCYEATCYCRIVKKINKYIKENVLSPKDITSYDYFMDEYTWSLKIEVKQFNKENRTNLCYMRSKVLTMGTTFVFIVMAKEFTDTYLLFNLPLIDSLLRYAENDIMLINDKYSLIKEGIEKEVSNIMYNNDNIVDIDNYIDTNYNTFCTQLDTMIINQDKDVVKALYTLKHLIDANYQWSKETVRYRDFTSFIKHMPIA